MMNTIRIFAPLAWRNLWRNPRRTLITLVVVSVGLWSVLAFNSFLNAWTQASKDTTLQLLLGQGQIHAAGYMDDPGVETLMPPPSDGLLKALGDKRINAWATRLVVPSVVQSEYKTLPVMIVGVDPKAEGRVSSIPGKVVEGRYLNGPDDDGVVIGRHLAERLKTGLGRRVILMSQGADGLLAEQSFDVVGLYDVDQQTEDYYVFTGRTAGQKFLRLKDEIAEIVFTIPKDQDLAPVIRSLKAVAPDMDVRSWKQLSPFLAATNSFMSGFIYIWLSVVFTLMAIGIVNTQLMAVFERTHEFGLLQALGMKPRLVLIMVTMESTLLIGLGVLIGMAMAAASIWVTSDGIDLSGFARGLELVQGGQVLYPKFDAGSFVLFSLVIWILGIVVALWPARRASKCSPVEAMRMAT
ncbi:MAG: FtsX-like permease family protein [Paracoccaceae bacterium]|nr:FtsX-like permease family protein [Paracoccaceae bacterium]